MSLETTNPPPPADSKTTQVGLQEVSALCQSNNLIVSLNGALLRLMQEHFSSPSNLIYANEWEANKLGLGDLVWTPPPADGSPENHSLTSIHIDTNYSYNPWVIQRRPAIYLKRNALQQQNIGIGGGMTVTFRDSSGCIVPRGNYQARLFVGSYSYFCCAKTQAAAELLGAEVHDWLTAFSRFIEADLSLHRFEVTNIDEVSLVDEAAKHYVTPVNVSLAAARAWYIDVERPWLKTVAVCVLPERPSKVY